VVQLKAFKNYGAIRNEAEALVRRYDRNGDQALTQDEVGRERFLGRSFVTTTSRISSSHLMTTTSEVERYARIDVDAWRRADMNSDGALTAAEVLDEYGRQRDRNGNGDLGWWERLGMGPNDMLYRLESFFNRERVVGRNLVYDPIPDYDRPVPPRPDYDRPTPPRPDGSRPTPPRPDYDRPTPPRPDGSRPTPPRPDYDRPTPPRPDGSRPTPPRPDYDRPTPPRPDGSRPTPPRPDYDRPTPPRPDGSRPTPPRPDYDRPTPPRPDASRPTPPRPDYDRPTPPRPEASRPTPPRPDFDRPAPPDVL
jgi:hypothetical protein